MDYINYIREVKKTMDEATEIIRSFNEERIAHQIEMAEMKERLEASKSALIKSERAALDCFHERSKLRAKIEELKSQLEKHGQPS